VEAVRSLVKAAKGFAAVQVVEASQNQGLASSVISGVGKVLDLRGRCIVVEDDLEFSPGFLDFLGAALDRYQDEPGVFTLSGYAPPPKRVPVAPAASVWFAPRPCSWGWAIWKDRWDKVDWSVPDRGLFLSDRTARRRLDEGGRDLSYFLKLQLRGQLDSWAVRLAWSQSRLGGLTLYPARSFVTNGGLDGSGTHSQAQKDQDISLMDAQLPLLWPPAQSAPEALLRRFRRHYEGSWTERWGQRWKKLSRRLGIRA